MKEEQYIILLCAVLLVSAFVLADSEQKQFFTLEDIESRGKKPEGELVNNAKRLVKTLNTIQRELYKKDSNFTIVLTSTYRNKEHNSAVGGAKNSYHLYARAADFKVDGMDAGEVQKFVKLLMEKGKIPIGGIGLGSSFTHIDNRGERKAWKYSNGSGAGTYAVDWNSF